MAAHGNVYTVLRARREMPGPQEPRYVTQVQKPESTVLAVSLAREPQSEHARAKGTQMERTEDGREWAHSRVASPT